MTITKEQFIKDAVISMASNIEILPNDYIVNNQIVAINNIFSIAEELWNRFNYQFSEPIVIDLDAGNEKVIAIYLGNSEIYNQGQSYEVDLVKDVSNYLVKEFTQIAGSYTTQEALKLDWRIIKIL